MQEPFMTYAEAAQKLGGVSVSTVRRLVREGKLTARAISTRCHRVDAASVHTYLRDSIIKPAGSTGGMCQSGRTVARTAGESSGTALSVREAVAHAKKLLAQRRKHA